jgi:hypothetical protein
MLTRMAMKSNGVAEIAAGYRAERDYEHEHRFAEHEDEAEPEPDANEPPIGSRAVAELDAAASGTNSERARL